MSKIHCDICNVDINKNGLAHHKKTNKHIIEEAKKYGKYDFTTHQIVSGGELIKPNISEISLNLQDVLDSTPNDTLKDIHKIMKPSQSGSGKIVFDRPNPNLSKKEIYTNLLALLEDYFRDIEKKPTYINQLKLLLNKTK